MKLKASNMSFSIEEHAKLDKAAARYGKSKGHILRTLVDKFLDENGLILSPKEVKPAQPIVNDEYDKLRAQHIEPPKITVVQAPIESPAVKTPVREPISTPYKWQEDYQPINSNTSVTGKPIEEEPKEDKGGLFGWLKKKP